MRNGHSSNSVSLLGSRINVNELQTKIGVSCTPIRERWETDFSLEGLISYKNNFGASVLSLDVHDVEEIQELAMTLHCAAIKLFAENGATPKKPRKNLKNTEKLFCRCKNGRRAGNLSALLIGVLLPHLWETAGSTIQ